MNRQRALLTAFLILFGCSLFYGFLRMPRQKTVAKLTYVQGMTAATAKPARVDNADPARVRLDLLEPAAGAVVVARRNIFSPIFAEESQKLKIPLPPPPPPPQKAQLPVQPVVTQPPPPVVADPTPLQRDMAKFTFLGFLQKENKKTIFLSSDKEIFLVKKGDKIAGRYDVTSLTDETLTISSIADGGEIIIPLQENRPLNAPRK